MSENAVFAVFWLFPLAAGGLLWCFIYYCRRQVSTHGWGRLLLGNLLVLFVLLSVVFIGGETYYRFFYDTTDSLSYTKISRRWYDRHDIRNHSGFRDDIEYFPNIVPGKRRISFVGDSFTAGHGINDIADRFPNRIRRAHPEWEIHVLGLAGFDTEQELQMLRDLSGNGYRLDEVVLVYCLNDVGDMLFDWNMALDKIVKESQNEGWFRRNSYFLNTMYHRFQASRNPYIKDYYHSVEEGYRGKFWEWQQRRLAGIYLYVQSQGGHLSVVTFPFLHAVGPGYKFQFVHDELAAFWKQLGVPALDLLSVYSNLPPSKITVNRYDAHPNEFANALAAKQIEEFLKTNLATSVSSPGS
jgi:hypothetical protein